MKWFRHLIRLPDNIPSNTTLKYSNEETKRPRSRQRLTTKKMMEKHLNGYNLNWDLAIQMAIENIEITVVRCLF